MNLRSTATHGLCAVALLCITGQASAGILDPGEFGVGSADMTEFYPLPDAAELQGGVLAERSETHEVRVTERGVGEFAAQVLVTTRVVREQTRGRLDFYYSLEQTEGATVDFDRLWVASFASFTTDVYFDLTEPVVTRSDDSETLLFSHDERIDNTFLVRTDATAFDANGSFRLDVWFPQVGLGDTVTLATFQPVADDDGPTPNPIPLPPAAWAALATMGGFGAVKRLRRRG